MARASTPTLLALDNWAAVLGVNPPHFNTVAGATYFPVAGSCNDLFWQYSWQAGDKSSREELAYAIQRSEDDLTAALGFPPAPQWIAEEHPWPPYRNVDVWRLAGWDSRGHDVGLQANLGKYIRSGQRATYFAGRADVAYSNPDGDDLDELGTATLLTAFTDTTELKFYFAGHEDNPAWEVRPALTKTADGTTLTATFWRWQLVEPALWEAFPTSDGLDAVNIATDGNFVTTLNVYREYVDTTADSCTFYWEPAECEGCDDTTQGGCLHVRNKALGLVIPTPATYDSVWTWSAFTEGREPDKVRIYYQAGDVEPRYTAGYLHEPMPYRWQQAIAWMATARLERPICACGNLEALFADLRQDMAFAGSAGSFQVSFDELQNPFGTRKGEIMAWRKVVGLQNRQEYIRHAGAI